MDEIKWSKKSEKLLDEIFEGEEEITLRGKLTVEETLEDWFGRFCGIHDGLISNNQTDKRSILIICLKNGEFEEMDVTELNSDEVKCILKDKDMFGYMMSLWVNKLDKGKKVGEAQMRTLYSPKIFIKNIKESGHEPLICKNRKGVFDCYDYYSITEYPEGTKRRLK